MTNLTPEQFEMKPSLRIEEITNDIYLENPRPEISPIEALDLQFSAVKRYLDEQWQHREDMRLSMMF